MERIKPIIKLVKNGIQNPRGGFLSIRKIFFIIKKSYELKHISRMLSGMHSGEIKDFSEYQNKKLYELLNYAYRNCEYYRNKLNITDLHLRKTNYLKQLLLLDKEIIRKNFDKIVSKNNGLNYKMNTGGSTGEPLEFYVSYFAGLIDCIHQKFLYKLIGYRSGDKIFAFGGVTVPTENIENNKYWINSRSGDIPYGRRHYSSLYLNNKTIKFYIKDIMVDKPNILRGFPSFLNELAEHILKYKIDLKYTIKGIELTSENTYDFQIKNIKDAFKTKVFFQYGQSEVNVFGYTQDESYEYICSPFYGITEILDKNGVDVKEGEIGEVVATGFYNKAQPFIRYKTGDMAVYGGKKNGRVMLKKIIGRTQDYIYTKEMEKIALTALVFGQHFGSFKNISKWQIVQKTAGKIVIRLLKNSNISKGNLKEIRDKFYKFGKIDIDFEMVERIPLTKNGKFKFLIQKINGDKIE